MCITEEIWNSNSRLGNQIHPEMKTYKKHVQNRKIIAFFLKNTMKFQICAFLLRFRFRVYLTSNSRPRIPIDPDLVDVTDSSAAQELAVAISSSGTAPDSSVAQELATSFFFNSTWISLCNRISRCKTRIIFSQNV